MQLSQEIFNILKGANIKLKLFDPIGNKTLDPELSARFYAYDQDFLITIRDEDDQVELVVQAGASFNFNQNKDLLDSIKRAGHNAMAEYTIRKFDKNIEPKDFAHENETVKEDNTEEIRRLKELSGITEAPAQPDTAKPRFGQAGIVAELVGEIYYFNNHYDRDERKDEMQTEAGYLKLAAKTTGDKDIIAGAQSVEHLCNHRDFDEVQDMLNNKLQELNQLVGGNKLEIEENKRDESVEEGDKIELTEWVWLLPVLATAVRVGVPALKLLLKGGKAATKVIKPVAVNTTKTLVKGATPQGVILGAGGMYAWDKVSDVVDAIKGWGEDDTVVDMEEDELNLFAEIVIKYGIPAAAVGALLYGGIKLKNYMDGNKDDEKEDEVVHNAHGIEGMTTTYSSNLSTEEVTESYAKATGSFKTSYIQLPESTRLIIRHSKGVNEEVRGSRSRNIKALFIENSAGERFSFPHKYLQGAKAMAKHVSMGGTPYDAIGESIITLCTEVAQCNQFIKHVRTNKLVNESNLNIVETVKTKLNELKNTIKGLQTVKGYNDYQVESTAIVVETEKEVDETVDLTDKFMYNTFTKTANMDAVLETVARIIKERDSMTDLTKQYIMRLYDMIKDKEDFKLTIDANDPEHPDNEDPIKYSGGQGQMAKLSASLTYLAMNSKNDEAFNILSHLGSELYDLSQQHISMLAKIVVYLDRNSKVGSAKAVEQESIVESIMTGLRREIA